MREEAVAQADATRAGIGPAPEPDGHAAWRRLWISLALVTLGSSGMWCVVVVLPAIQAEFAIDRAAAALPYTALMCGVAIGGVAFGRLSDRHGIVPVAIAGGALLGVGFILAGLAPSLPVFVAAHGLLIGIGCSATFGPVLADISLWFRRRRGMAVGIAASGNYMAGVIWPPLVQHATEAYGWRTALLAMGATCLAASLPLALLLRTRSRPAPSAPEPAGRVGRIASAGLRPGIVQALLVVAALACCIAMGMPQVHLVAYCADLGYGPARGAEMLALMLGFGIVSRIGSGFVADRIGGLMTLLLGSALQGCALFLYTLVDGLASLYAVSILFGLFQGGIVPSYAIIVRELFPPREAGRRVGMCISATLVGMAAGGWMSGWIFDLTGSYRAAFANGVAWNLVNASVALFLLLRLTPGPGRLSARPAT